MRDFEFIPKDFMGSPLKMKIQYFYGFLDFNFLGNDKEWVFLCQAGDFNYFLKEYLE